MTGHPILIGERRIVVMTGHKRASRSDRRRGASAVEMALVTPLFLMLMFGITEFGRAMMVSKMVANAAREGARTAVLDGATNAEVTSQVQAYMKSAMGLPASNVSVAISTSPAAGNPDPSNVIANCLPGDLISVQVQVPFNKVAIIPGNYLGGKLLTGHSSMRHE